MFQAVLVASMTVPVEARMNAGIGMLSSRW
jgi:hypothetical protein